MAILKVARLGHPVLRHKASDVEIKDIKAGKLRPLAWKAAAMDGGDVHGAS